MKRRPRVIHRTNGEANAIHGFLLCQRCVDERPKGESMRSWSRLEVGVTADGVQVWCVRHEINVDRMIIVHPDDDAHGGSSLYLRPCGICGAPLGEPCRHAEVVG